MKNLWRGIAIAAACTMWWLGAPQAQTSQNGPYYSLPSWDQQLPASSRFIVLSNWNNAAVLDRETGLVWQRKPAVDPDTWANALLNCRTVTVGRRRGWRLPGQEEAYTLVDPTQHPDLPAGHPFLGIGATDIFWTASTFEPDATSAYTLFLANAVETDVERKTFMARYWCVRGGQATTNPTQ